MRNEIPTRSRGLGDLAQLALSILIAAAVSAAILSAPIFSEGERTDPPKDCPVPAAQAAGSAVDLKVVGDDALATPR